MATEPSITWERHDGPSSPAALAHVSGITAMPLSTPSHLLSDAQHQCSTPVTEASATSSRGPIRSLWLADISRPMRQEGSFVNASRLPWRLQDKVPRALPTLQHCWPALWALMGGHRQHAARSWGPRSTRRGIKAYGCLQPQGLGVRLLLKVAAPHTPCGDTAGCGPPFSRRVFVFSS